MAADIRYMHIQGLTRQYREAIAADSASTTEIYDAANAAWANSMAEGEGRTVRSETTRVDRAFHHAKRAAVAVVRVKLSALEEARGQAEPFHAGPASPDSHCMSAYEHTRLLNVARNMAELERLGLRAVS